VLVGQQPLRLSFRQDRVEGSRELTGSIADEEPEPGGVVAEVYDEVAGLLGGPESVGMGP